MLPSKGLKLPYVICNIKNAFRQYKKHLQNCNYTQQNTQTKKRQYLPLPRPKFPK